MKILISQKTPTNLASYSVLKEKYGADLEFHPFFLIEPLSAKEFRAQHINLPDYTAVVFSSRHAIDAYFKLCEEMRFKVPETMKYFCTSEIIALYLQKHVVYRKRKIFFGEGSAESLITQIGPKHKGERYLITTSAESNSEAMTALFEKAGLDYTVGVMVKSVAQDLTGLNLSDYKAAVLYNTYDVKSLFTSFPEFKQDGLDFITYGKSIVGAMKEAGLDIALQAPTPEIPSVIKALDIYLHKK